MKKRGRGDDTEKPVIITNQWLFSLVSPILRVKLHWSIIQWCLVSVIILVQAIWASIIWSTFFTHVVCHLHRGRWTKKGLFRLGQWFTLISVWITRNDSTPHNEWAWLCVPWYWISLTVIIHYYITSQSDWLVDLVTQAIIQKPVSPTNIFVSLFGRSAVFVSVQLVSWYFRSSSRLRNPLVL